MTTDFDAAYWAGVVDSDGSISITRRRSARYRRGFYYTVMVQLGWRESPLVAELVDELWRRYGGSVSRGRGGSRMRQMVYYRAQSRVALRLLEELTPHLRLKRAQAEECLRFGRRLVGRSRYAQTPESQSLDDEMFESVRMLNGYQPLGSE